MDAGQTTGAADALARRVADAMYAQDDASRNLGIRLEAVGAGWARMSMPVTEEMLNGHRVCHGGYIFSLADSAMAFASNSRNRVSVAQFCSITFLRPGRQGPPPAGRGAGTGGRRTHRHICGRGAREGRRDRGRVLRGRPSARRPDYRLKAARAGSQPLPSAGAGLRFAPVLAFQEQRDRDSERSTRLRVVAGNERPAFPHLRIARNVGERADLAEADGVADEDFPPFRPVAGGEDGIELGDGARGGWRPAPAGPCSAGRPAIPAFPAPPPASASCGPPAAARGGTSGRRGSDRGCGVRWRRARAPVAARAGRRRAWRSSGRRSTTGRSP